MRLSPCAVCGVRCADQALTYLWSTRREVVRDGILDHLQQLGASLSFGRHAQIPEQLPARARKQSNEQHTACEAGGCSQHRQRCVLRRVVFTKDRLLRCVVCVAWSVLRVAWCALRGVCSACCVVLARTP